MKVWATKQKGFTIVELLIVIVIIGILAAITIVAYNGIQNRANDTAVQSDLRNIAGKINEYKVINDKLPTPTTDLAAMNIKVSRNAYGAHYVPSVGNENNLIYCYSSLTSSNATFIIVAAAKSGNVFVYRDGSVQNGVGPLTTFTTTCANNGLSSTGSWFYAGSVWQSWIST